MNNTGQLAVLGDEHMAPSISQQLAAAGYTVAHELSSTNIFDAVIIAVEDFSAVQRLLGSVLSEHALPSIVLIRSATSEDVSRVLEAGANYCLCYPLESFFVLEQIIKQSVIQWRRFNELQTMNEKLQRGVALLQRDQQAGHQVQLSMLPPQSARLAGFDFSYQLIPSLYISGDFVDYFSVGSSHSVFFIADVSGHGVAPGFCTVLLKKLFARAHARFCERGDLAILSPASMLRLANEELLSINTDQYATMVVGVVDNDKRTLTYSIAGHLPLPVLFDGSQASYLSGEGAPVGLMANVNHQEYHVTLSAGASLALFSDGILEVLEQDSLLKKEDALLALFSQFAGRGEALLRKLGVCEGLSAPDDVTALFMESVN